MPDAAKVEAAPKPKAPRKGRPLPSPLAVITAALGLFFVVLTLLAIQVRNGRDPALGPGPVVTLTQPAATGGAQATQQATSIVTRTSPAPPP
jgi:hypothetical protein